MSGWAPCQLLDPSCLPLLESLASETDPVHSPESMEGAMESTPR